MNELELIDYVEIATKLALSHMRDGEMLYAQLELEKARDKVRDWRINASAALGPMRPTKKKGKRR